MDKKHFSSLDKIEKIIILINHGEVITEFEASISYNSLFVLNDFFIEVHLNKFTNEIDSVFVLENTEKLYFFVQELVLDIPQLSRS